MAGSFLGLCFLTKIQAIFYLVAAPLLLLRAAAPAGGVVAAFAPRTKREANHAAAIGSLAFVLFAALLVHAHSTPGPSPLEHQTFAAEFRLTGLGLAALALYAAVAGLLVALVIRGTWTSPVFAFLRACALLLLGFVLAFALHLVPFGWSGEGLRYMAYDTKVLFFRGSFAAGQAELGRVEQLWRQLAWDPALLALLGLFAFTSLREIWDTHFERARAAGGLVQLGLASIALLNAAIASRFVLRDVVWTQVLAMVVVLIASFDFFRRRTTGRVIVIGLLALVMVEQLAHGRDVIRRLEANYNLYGFREDRWFKGVYFGDHLRYAAIMKNHYGGENSPLRDVAQRSARRYGESRRTADYVLQEQGIDLRRIGVLSEGFPIWVGDESLRVTALPEDLREATVIDPTSAIGRHSPIFLWSIATARERSADTGSPGRQRSRPDLQSSSRRSDRHPTSSLPVPAMQGWDTSKRAG